MRLERLEIKGFKSFANQTTIHFKEDVTGIVGPNGSGKSNIVDAIRWVLGEQKQKDLRLEKMSDVIFNGTKKKKAGGLAYVSLTFENSKGLLASEYNTVTIARYLYNTGESEYRLNNVTCRLKDIRSLFLDTGIGSNSYAIIALGMVEDILADKENARRRMFEQAAGISKYKSRKRETLLKLNSTQADLDRVEDLLFEIEKNLKTLEKQAKRTQKYVDLKEQYKALSLDLAVLKSKDLRENYHLVGKQVTEAEDAFRNAEVQLRNHDARVEELKRQHLDKEKSLTEFQKGMNELISNIRAFESELKILEQRKEYEAHNQNLLSNRIARNETRLEEFQNRLAKDRELLTQDKIVETERLSELSALEKDLDSNRQSHGSVKESVDSATRKFQEKQGEVMDLEKTLAVSDSSLQSLKQEIQRLKDQVVGRSEDHRVLEDELKKHQVILSQQTELLAGLEEDAFRMAQERGQLEKEEDDLLNKLNKLRRSHDAKKHEFDLVKNLVEKLEGFPDSIKYLNKNFKWKKSAPLFSDILYCKEDYRAVIEHYLEPYLNHYVVSTFAEATAAVNLLSDTQKGRAHFFVLESFLEQQAQDDVPAGAIAAVEVVDFDEKHRALIEHLLHNVLIVDFQVAERSILDQWGERFTVLSRDGKYVRRRNTLGGGSVGLFEGNKLGRKKNLKRLEKEIAALLEEINRDEKALDLVNDKLVEVDEKDQSEALEVERQNLEELKRQEVYLKSQFEHLSGQTSDTQSNVSSLESRMAEIEAEKTTCEAKLASARQDLENERIALLEMDGSFDLISRDLADRTSQLNDKQIEIVRIQSKLEATGKEVEFAQSQIKVLEETLGQDHNALAGNEEALQEISQQQKRLDAQLLQAYEERKGHEEDLSGLEQTYYAARKEINDAEEEVRKLHRQQSERQQLINDLKDRYNELKFGMNNVAERLRIEFDISLDQVLEQHEAAEHDLEALEDQVTKIRNRIANFGEINPMALEAYDEMHERYEAIVQQRDDVLDARDSLMETIKEIEDTATERFMEAFSSVRVHFQNVFRSLFTEDDACDLVLLNPADPLSSAIEIIAKPKGKRPKSISQLSGGEKTLTAIALLFGLYLLKPAPFCIFDEVDAPLDDSNVEKFNRIIKEFSKDSQFVIVTHNKLTMAAVDVIYGVYMEEQGISGVTQVDFRDFEHTSFLEEVN